MNRRRSNTILNLWTWILLLIPAISDAARIKDIVSIKGVRENKLMGSGVVVGLNGTGDSGELTALQLTGLLSKMGITIDSSQLAAKNVATVMVTATLPPFARSGTKIDVQVSSMGNAKSLVGGTLLLTALQAANGDIYAAAQGPLTVGGYAAAAGGSSQVKNHPTVASIAGGALVEREVPVTLKGRTEIELMLHRADFTTAIAIEGAINERMAQNIAAARDSGTIDITIPEPFLERIPELIALVEDIDVPVDSVARVVLNERTGTVVMGDRVRIGRVAIAHGSLTLQIETTPIISQPGPFSRAGNTVNASASRIESTDDNAGAGATPIKVVEGATIGDVVGALNALGVSPRDLITILQAIRAAGALYAELEII